MLQRATVVSIRSDQHHFLLYSGVFSFSSGSYLVRTGTVPVLNVKKFEMLGPSINKKTDLDRIKMILVCFASLRVQLLLCTVPVLR